MSDIIRNSVLCLGILVIRSASLSAAQQQLPPLPPPPSPATMRSVPIPVAKPPPAQPAQPAPAISTQAVPVTASVQVTNPLAPRIQFATNVIDIGRVKAGDPVKFTYIFTNVGKSRLEIIGVQPTCGCTVAGEWTKTAEPGQTGEVPLQFNTASYHGQVFKSVTVSCNDPMQPHVVLQVRGNIWKPIDFVPPYTVMNLLPDMANATATVKIVNNMEQPLDVMSPVCAIKGFSAELKTNQPGKEFQLIITATPPLKPGTVSGKVTVQTSATNTPSLDIPFWANVQAAVMALPPQVMISAGPLTAKATPSVTIQNNTTNALLITEPAVDLPGVEVQIRELQPGRIFSLQLAFPAGFELKPGQQGTLSLKTSNPQFAEMKVPIIQIPKPAVPAPGAAPPAQPVRAKLQPSKPIAPGKILLPSSPPANPPAPGA